MTFEDFISLQSFVMIYLRQLEPVLNHGQYYLQYIVRCYVRNGYSGTSAELLRQASQRYGRRCDTIASCVQRFARGAFRRDDAEVLILRWREIGWDETVPLTASHIIPMVCQGFYPYMERHFPEKYQELLDISPPKK